MERKKWVDLGSIKQAVSWDMVLSHYGITNLKKQGNKLRGPCPIHKGTGSDSFSINTAMKAFKCFSCNKGGNVLAFVASMENCDALEAGRRLQQWFSLQGMHSPPNVNGSSARDMGAGKAGDEVERNKPLTFHLRIDADHEYGLDRVSKQTIEKFGAGLCVSRGMFAGRYVIPLHDHQGQLVGYAGRGLDDAEPKYLLPPGFKKSVLFNLHRILNAPESKDSLDGTLPVVVVVEGIFGCMRIDEAQFPCVALMGCVMTKAQEKYFAHFQRVLLMLDGDEAGRQAAEGIASRLNRRCFVKVVDLPANGQPDHFDTAQLARLIVDGSL